MAGLEGMGPMSRNACKLLVTFCLMRCRLCLGGGKERGGGGGTAFRFWPAAPCRGGDKCSFPVGSPRYPFLDESGACRAKRALRAATGHSLALHPPL